MKDEKETRGKLLKSAKQEFMEKGYMQASLRNICKNAGVTTGALYFFFRDKEDLFASIVEAPLKKLHGLMKAHYEGEMQQVSNGDIGKEDFSDDIMKAKQVIHYLYAYREECELLLTKSQGSRFENCIDQFVEMTELHFRGMRERAATQLGRTDGIQGMDDYMLHWIAHINIDIFVHTLTHEASEEAAAEHIERIVQYLIDGWQGMFAKDGL